MAREWTPEGVSRAPLPRFLLWLAPWIVLALLGLYATTVFLRDGLGATGMDNRYVFGLWIVFDLAIIALGAGAFFIGFLSYILKRKELEPILGSAVVVGFLCYSGALVSLVVDVGQPLRSWFILWHANIHSMLTEVTVCLTVYLGVLCVEYLPLVLRNRQLRKVPAYLVLEGKLHKIMAVLAGVGAFLSFFHQGSLGGMFGVMYGRPFAFREHLAIFPTTFFLFILSAIAAGPMFMSLIAMAAERLSGKRLVPVETHAALGRISGILFAVYFAFKLLDTACWWFGTVPGMEADPRWFYANAPYGSWMLALELGVFGLIPPIILLGRKRRQSMRWLAWGGAFGCVGVVFNRFVVVIQSQAVPTLVFDDFFDYAPTWQEWGLMVGVVAYGVLVYSLSYRYLPLFSRERELSHRGTESRQRYFG